MEVSTFELLYKPQSPAAPVGTTAVERVVQGYFLTITNLEDEQYRFALEFVISPPPATTTDQAYRSLAGNTLVFVDTPGADNVSGVLNGSLTASSFRSSTGLITIPPRGTALVAVLPSAFGPTPLDPTPLTELLFEVRGYVRITLPALFPPLTPGGPFPFFRVPQSDSPVQVMLTPQHRATFLTAGNAISDQIQASLPLASGQARNAIDPEPGGPIIVLPTLEEADVLNALAMLESNPELADSNMLAALLSQVDPERVDLSKFNRQLSEAKIPVAIERRSIS